MTLHLVEVEDPSRFGVVPTDDSGRVTAFLEKTPNPVTNRINAGCYVFRREVIGQIPAGRRVSVERETFPGLIESGQLVMGYHESAYWLDVGTPQAFVRGSCDLVLGRLPAPAVPGPAGPALLLQGAEVAPDASVSGGTVVGARASVAAGADVFGSVLFEDATVGQGAVVRDSIVGRGAVVAPGAVLHDAVLGDGAFVGPGNELARGIRSLARCPARADLGPLLLRRVTATQPAAPDRDAARAPDRTRRPAPDQDAGLRREWRAPFGVDVRLTLSPYRHGGRDPAYRVDQAGAVWRTSLTPDGPGTLRVDLPWVR